MKTIEFKGNVYQMERPLQPDEYVVSCHECGKMGIEDASDPAPGLCPKCFERYLDNIIGMALMTNSRISREEARNLLQQQLTKKYECEAEDNGS